MSDLTEDAMAEMTLDAWVAEECERIARFAAHYRKSATEMPMPTVPTAAPISP